MCYHIMLIILQDCEHIEKEKGNLHKNESNLDNHKFDKIISQWPHSKKYPYKLCNTIILALYSGGIFQMKLCKKFRHM